MRHIVWWLYIPCTCFTFNFANNSKTLTKCKRSSQSVGTTADRTSIQMMCLPSNLVAKRVILSPIIWMAIAWRRLNVVEEAQRYFIISSCRHALVHSRSFKKSSWLCGVSCWLNGLCYHQWLSHKCPFFLTLSIRSTSVQPCPGHMFQVHQTILNQCRDDIFLVACMMSMLFRTYNSKCKFIEEGWSAQTRFYQINESRPVAALKYLKICRTDSQNRVRSFVGTNGSDFIQFAWKSLRIYLASLMVSMSSTGVLASQLYDQIKSRSLGSGWSKAFSKNVMATLRLLSDLFSHWSFIFFAYPASISTQPWTPSEIRVSFNFA